MAEKTEDLKLPLSVIGRLIKEALPEGVAVSKEARTAIARAASVFILHTTNFANQTALAAKRKTINGNDVVEGIRELECDSLLEPVKAALELWRANKTVTTPQRKKKDTADEGGAQPATILADDGDVSASLEQESEDLEEPEEEDSVDVQTTTAAEGGVGEEEVEELMPVLQDESFSGVASAHSPASAQSDSSDSDDGQDQQAASPAQQDVADDDQL